MTAGNIHVFTGPSLPGQLARQLLPDAVIHGPVEHGTVLRLPLHPKDRLAIIDGVFFQAAAVRHKELLYALSRGVEVWGAASMGALRAAELRAFGMCGVGLVFRLFASGALERDDEVAVAHQPAEGGYAPLSTALVSVRLHLRRARRRGLIDADDERQVVEAARNLPFAERRYPIILRHARARGVSAAACEALRDFIDGQADDIKREDAIRLLRMLGTQGPSDNGHALPPVALTTYLARWLDAAHGREVDGQWVTDMATLTFCQLFASDYPAFHYHVILDELVRASASSPEAGEASSDERLEQQAVECARRRGLIAPSSQDLPLTLAVWLSPAEAHGRFEMAVARALVRSFRYEPGVSPTGLLLAAARDTAAFSSAQQQVAKAQRLNATLARQASRVTVQSGG